MNLNERSFTSRRENEKNDKSCNFITRNYWFESLDARSPIFDGHSRQAKSFPLVDNAHPYRRQTVRTENVIATVKRGIQDDPNKFLISYRVQQFEECPSPLWKILQRILVCGFTEPK